MIKLQFNFDEIFKSEYRIFCENSFNSQYSGFLNELPSKYKHSFESSLDEKFWKTMFLLEPENLEKQASYIFKNSPILKEVFLTEELLSSLTLCITKDDIDKRLKKASLEKKVNKDFDAITNFINNNSTLELGSWFNKEKKNHYTGKYSIVKKFFYMKQGEYNFTKYYNANWVSQFKALFDHQAVFRKFSNQIVECYSLNYCPYCNAEKVKVRKSGNNSKNPDIDHFFPKSKYPFFSITLSNLIPCCDLCNELIKKSKNIKGLITPFLYGVEKGFSKTLFDYKYTEVSEQTYEFEKLEIIVTENYKSLSNNVKFFTIEEQYNDIDNKGKLNAFLNYFKYYSVATNRKCVSDLDEKSVKDNLHITMDDCHSQHEMNKCKLDLINNFLK